MKQMIKFLADECVFSLTVELLKNRGWNVVSGDYDADLSRLPDCHWVISNTFQNRCIIKKQIRAIFSLFKC